MQYLENIVTCLLKIGIAEPEETAVSKERPVNTLPRQHIHERIDSGTVEAMFFLLGLPRKVKSMGLDKSEVSASER
jgi:hypothetical protein